MTGMNISIVGVLLGVLLLAFPLGMLYWLDRKSLVRTGKQLVQWLVFVALTAAVLRYVFVFNRSWLNIVYVIVMIITAVVMYAKKAKYFVPLLVGTAVAVTVVACYILMVVFRTGNALDARWLIPVCACLTADGVWIGSKGLQAYDYNRRTHNGMFEFLIGNGAKPAEAMKRFARKAVLSAFVPAFRRLSTMGMVVVPAMMAGLLLAGADVIGAALVFALIAIGGLCCGGISIAVSIIVSEQQQRKNR